MKFPIMRQPAADIPETEVLPEYSAVAAKKQYTSARGAKSGDEQGWDAEKRATRRTTLDT